MRILYQSSFKLLQKEKKSTELQPILLALSLLSLKIASFTGTYLLDVLLMGTFPLIIVLLNFSLLVILADSNCAILPLRFRFRIQ